MTTEKLICAVESGKYEGATFVVGEEYIMESTFIAKRSPELGLTWLLSKRNTFPYMPCCFSYSFSTSLG